MFSLFKCWSECTMRFRDYLSCVKTILVFEYLVEYFMPTVVLLAGHILYFHPFLLYWTPVSEFISSFSITINQNYEYSPTHKKKIYFYISGVQIFTQHLAECSGDLFSLETSFDNFFLFLLFVLVLILINRICLKGIIWGL